MDYFKLFWREIAIPVGILGLLLIRYTQLEQIQVIVWFCSPDLIKTRIVIKRTLTFFQNEMYEIPSFCFARLSDNFQRYFPSSIREDDEMKLLVDALVQIIFQYMFIVQLKRLCSELIDEKLGYYLIFRQVIFLVHH